MSDAFVVSQFAELAGLSREKAVEWLEDFARAGVCERVAGGWVLTSKDGRDREGTRPLRRGRQPQQGRSRRGQVRSVNDQ